jgi:peptidoglycan/LPS O-acetylase OafA/YrhL
LIWLGLKANFVKWGQNNDFSYGIYIYAFPIQQFVALLFPAAPFAAHVLLAIIFTFPFAILSWFLVERPAIGSARRLLAKFSKETQ